eukprot:914907-Amphidinium_carterae.1
MNVLGKNLWYVGKVNPASVSTHQPHSQRGVQQPKVKQRGYQSYMHARRGKKSAPSLMKMKKDSKE